MDTENLRAFIEVAQQHSFSLAAQKLHLTQPAVSKRIAALEQQLGQSLFHRINRRVELTQAGHTLLGRATQILHAVAETRRAMADFSDEVRGELRVATSHHVGLHKLPPVLRQFVALYPQVNLRFEFLDSEVAHDRVLKGVCELAVVTLAPQPSTQLDLLPIWDDPLVFVANSTIAPTITPSLAALSLLPAILPDLSTYTGRLVQGCFDAHQLPLNITMATNYLETIKMLVSVGLGWSVLPNTMVDSQVVSLALPVSLSRQLGVVCHPKRSLSNAASAFLHLLQQPADLSQTADT